MVDVPFSNPHHPTQNCAFVTVARLLRISPDELVKCTEIMQPGDNTEGYEFAKTEQLLEATGRSFVCQIYDKFWDLPPAGVMEYGMAYTRPDGTGHYVNWEKIGGTRWVMDYQHYSGRRNIPSDELKDIEIVGVFWFT